MPRKYTINPYTFVPLNRDNDNNKPLLSPEPSACDHLWFRDNRFSGKIHVKLEFITPAVIPGRQEKGSDKTPGRIHACRHEGHLAIPGSRLRQHLLALMRTINSSPITSFENIVIKKINVSDKVSMSNGKMANSPCLVNQLAGWTDVNKSLSKKSMKGRLWVEMALGPLEYPELIETKNLRILTSHPPKAYNFYLENGNYSAKNSRIRGRKVYWHNDLRVYVARSRRINSC